MLKVSWRKELMTWLLKITRTFMGRDFRETRVREGEILDRRRP